MGKPRLVLIHPAQDIDRLGSRRRRKSSVPKLNLPLLAARADDRFDVSIVDECIEDIDFSIQPDLVGITVITQVAHRAFEIADRYRRRGVKVVLGGFHVSFFPDEAAPHADALVIGEAEGAWDELLKDFTDGAMKQRYQTDTPHPLSGLPRPRLELLKKDGYSTPNVIETARGCPHACTFCAVSLFWGRKFRFRPVDEVIDEIRAMPPGDIVFVDDNIVGSPRRAKELFQAMIPLKRCWYSQSDLKMAKDPELLELAARSGCKWLFIGLESVDAANLEDVAKPKVNDVSDYAHSIARLRGAGIKVLGSFILGLDHDDLDVFDRTLQFCLDNRLEAANFYIFTPLPFTELFRQMDREGRILHRDWSRYDMNHVVFRPMKMTPEELLEGYLSTYRSFYSFPSILKRVSGFRRNLLQLAALNVGRRLNYKYFEEGCRY